MVFLSENCWNLMQVTDQCLMPFNTQKESSVGDPPPPPTKNVLCERTRNTHCTDQLFHNAAVTKPHSGLIVAEVSSPFFLTKRLKKSLCDFTRTIFPACVNQPKNTWTEANSQSRRFDGLQSAINAKNRDTDEWIMGRSKTIQKQIKRSLSGFILSSAISCQCGKG